MPRSRVELPPPAAAEFALVDTRANALLNWAAEVFIPVLLGLMFSYALSPIVDRLQSWHIPRAIGATIYSVEDDANALIESLPATAQKMRQALRPQTHTQDNAIANVQAAASQIEQAATDTAPVKAPGGITRVQIEAPKFNIKDHLWTGTLGLVGLVGQATVVLSSRSFCSHRVIRFAARWRGSPGRLRDGA